VITDEDIRDSVQRVLGRRIDDETWEFASNQEWIAGAREELDSGVDEGKVFDGLAERIGQALEYRSKPRTGESREIPPDGRDMALARVLGGLAAQDKSVLRFRKEVLRSRLLKPSKVPEWIRRRVDREGPPTFRRIVPVERGGTPLPTPFGFVKQTSLYLEFWDKDGAPMDVPIREDGALWRLKKLCKWLGEEYSFSEADAVAFVLSGRPAPAPRARAGYTLYPRLPARSVVRLEVNPRVSPREVAELYASMRGRLLRQMGLGTRSRSMTEEHAALAVFVSERQTSTWDDLRLEWNDSHPDRPFSDVRRFIRDVRAAYRRVTGEPLEWRGKD
jgi:hypothetical protein